VIQYQYIAWPDHDVPQTPFSFALMVQDICKWNTTGPIVIHCSAGVGRTGTLLLVLTLLDQLEGSGQLDAPGSLVSLRLGRPNLVENQAQYRFGHQVLLEVLFSEVTSYPVGKFLSYLEAIRDNLIAQYTKLKSLPRDLTFKWGENPAHAHMNRRQSILPVDGRQVFLQMLGGQAESQYVNAVRVNGVTQRDAVIVTEHPLVHTLPQVWRMVYERKVCAWVILHTYPDQEEEYPSVLPSRGEVDMDQVCVKVTAVNNHRHFIETSVALNFINSSILLPHHLRVLHLLGWDADQDLPDSPVPLLKLLEHLKDLRKIYPNCPVLISCSDGCTASGVAAALDVVLCRARLQGNVDVYRAVQGVLFDRPQFIMSFEQYIFLHDAAATYVNMLDDDDDDDDDDETISDSQICVLGDN
ncbi:Receptor-type tyrosine-protein phosphatase alpha-like, partial [Homarus americanus]